MSHREASEETACWDFYTCLGNDLSWRHLLAWGHHLAKAVWVPWSPCEEYRLFIKVVVVPGVTEMEVCWGDLADDPQKPGWSSF